MGSRTKTDSTVGLNSPLDHTTLQTLRGIPGGQRCDTDCVGHHQQEQHTAAIQGWEVIPCHLQQRNTQLSLKQINKQTKTPDMLLSPTTEEVPHIGTLSVGKFALFSQTHQVPSHPGSAESRYKGEAVHVGSSSSRYKQATQATSPDP